MVDPADLEIISLPTTGVVGFREDSIRVMARMQQIDADQVAAAFRFRSAFMTVLDAKHESMGFREWQSPRGITAALAERRLTAQEDLDAARKLLGAYSYALMGRICGEGYSMRDLFNTRRKRDTHTDILHIALSQLGKLWL